MTGPGEGRPLKVAEVHRCRIEVTVTRAPFYPGHPGYVPTCESCGELAVPQADPRDAHLAVNRHLPGVPS